MSKVALSAFVEVKVRVASHFLNVPSIATDASTSNLMLLSTGVISKTGTPVGACPQAETGKKMEGTRNRQANRIDSKAPFQFGLIGCSRRPDFTPSLMGKLQSLK